MTRITYTENLTRSVERELGTDSGRWHKPAGYQSVALAVLDSIYSTGNRYSGVINAVNTYCIARVDQGGKPTTDTASDFVKAVECWGGATGLVKRTNKWRAFARSWAPTKAEVAFAAGKILVDNNLETVDHVREAFSDPARQERSEVKRQWLALPGQRSGLTWTYFLMLCGVPGVKPDRMVIRYVSNALGESVNSKDARLLVSSVAQRLDLDEILLDHVLWRSASGRDVFRSTDTADLPGDA